MNQNRFVLVVSFLFISIFFRFAHADDKNEIPGSWAVHAESGPTIAHGFELVELNLTAQLGATYYFLNSCKNSSSMAPCAQLGLFAKFGEVYRAQYMYHYEDHQLQWTGGLEGIFWLAKRRIGFTLQLFGSYTLIKRNYLGTMPSYPLFSVAHTSSLGFATGLHVVLSKKVSGLQLSFLVHFQDLGGINHISLLIGPRYQF